ncbi:hypothetical protein [uncultured Muribaculum sp.]|uniref:hypothetical protein n=2 Tax=uncultured Muribaculum sp. TaxID=1918613 RepID=UPI0025D67E49|nr:hypothetical protein [uncultured Muribaculum sp.]
MEKQLHILYKAMAVMAAVMIFSVMSTSCSAPSVAEQKIDLDQAQALIDRSDYRSARSICDEIRELQAKGKERDANVLGRLSILYMKLSDAVGHEENVEYAYQCFLEAYSADSVAAQEYYSSLGIDDMPQGVLLAGIVRNAIKMPDTIEAADSVVSVIADTMVAE